MCTYTVYVTLLGENHFRRFKLSGSFWSTMGRPLRRLVESLGHQIEYSSLVLRLPILRLLCRDGDKPERPDLGLFRRC